MNDLKLGKILRSKYKKMTKPVGPKNKWYEYLRRKGIIMADLPTFVKLVNTNKLKGKVVT